MPALATTSASLIPAVPPLLSRCFVCCYSAVLSLFFYPLRAQKMELDQDVVDLPASPDFVAEQQIPTDLAEIAEPPKSRGRPWVKGQSGNPRGRPSRACQAAYVAEGLIARQTVPLTNKLDRAALRACLDRIVPARREPPIGLDLPETIDSRANLLAALTTVADAAASGALTSSQSAALAQMLIALRQATWTPRLHPHPDPPHRRGRELPAACLYPSPWMGEGRVGVKVSGLAPALGAQEGAATASALAAGWCRRSSCAPVTFVHRRTGWASRRAFRRSPAACSCSTSAAAR
jgi:hypothetical protein